MSKIIAFFRWPEGTSAFDDLLSRAQHLDAAGISLDRIVPRPDGLAYKPATDRADVRYDAILSLHGPTDPSGWRRLADAVSAVAHGYRVDDTPMFDRSAATTAGTRAYKIFSLLEFHADLPDSAARRSWRIHAPLAEKVHVGASRYVQNWVVERLSDDAPQARGMPELTFPTLEDLTERFFDSPRGQEEILHDTSHFVAGGPRFYVEEHVIR